ncbi:hypothetical protein [Mongoliitalea daihaiensis]|uniref:hypothetical protein n=1 Tax=Mongoliitalea daihaiensis TaxID=2782006 RepID=UPI001F2A15A4|nr:hypothetical protein [Mongoliitalea daihaiensis]UJP66093.1 hypothetical protein IPZ59_05570 [Mongoliitalea daihaiensis]
MKERIDLLIHKYWEGETSLEEEKELKLLLRQVDGYESAKEFFLGIYEFSQIDGKNPEQPMISIPIWKRPWLGYAASIAFVVSVAYGIFQHQQGKAEREAYEQVIAALSLIQENMQKGSESMEVLHELRHLQAPINLFDTEK